MQVRRMLQVSTGHITKQDAVRLEEIAKGDDADVPFPVYDTGYGWIIWRNAESDPTASIPTDAVEDIGLSESFRKVLREAMAHQCDFICFDCDESKSNDGPHKPTRLDLHDW